MICIDLYGTPVAWKRPQFSRTDGHLHGYDGQQKLKHGYKWQIISQFRNSPIEGPVCLDITFHMPIPKATSSIRKRQMLNGAMHHMHRPDLDNLQKFVLDCLSKIVIADDCQVVEIKAKKVYSERPGTYVKIIPMNQNGSISYAADQG